MKSVIRNIIISASILITSLYFTIPVWAEDIRETAKYKAPAMDQTIGFIQEMTRNEVGFEPEQCILIAKAAKNNVNFEYRIPLKNFNPSPGYVKPRLNCVTLTVDRFKKEIQRIGNDGKEEWRSKVDYVQRTKSQLSILHQPCDI
jgi:hypothetical protein